MKILKYLMMVVAAVAVLIGGAAAYIAATFNPNSYKPQIIQLVKDKKQRTLKLDGDIKLKFWPSIGADLGKVALSEFNSETEFAAIEHARVSLKLMPLLAKKVVVDEVEISGVRATIVKFKDGRMNIDDLLSKDDDKKQQHVEFDIDHVKLENAALTYRDEAQHATYALSNVNFKSGRIAPNVPTKLDLSMMVKSDKPVVNLGVALNTRLTFDLDNQVYTLDGMAFEAKGQALEVTNIDAKVTGNVNAKVKADEFTAKGLSVVLAALSKGTQINAKVSGDANAKLNAGEIAASGLTVALTAVNKEINLTANGNVTGSTTAKLHAGEVTANGLAMTITAMNKEMNLNAKVGGSLNARLNAGELTTNGLTVAVTGTHGKDNLDIKLDAPKLLITKDKASGDQVKVAAKITNPQGVTLANVVLPGIEGSAQAFKASGMTLDLDMKQGEQTVKAHLTSPLSGNLQTQQITLPQLALNLTATGPNLPGKSISGILTGSVSVNGSKQQVQANLAGKVADSTIKAQVGINGFTPPGVTFDVDFDQLDVDKYASQSADKPVAGGAGADKPIDVSALRALRANGTLRVGVLKASGLKASNVLLTVKAAGGQVAVSPLSANLYEGAMKGAVTVDAAQAIPAFTIQQNLNGVAVGPLLRDLANKDTLEGKGSVTLDVRTQGATVGALKRALNGGATVNLRNGSVKGIDIAGTLRDAQAKLGALGALKGQQTQQADNSKKTEFSEMTGSFAIQNGVAHNNDLSMKSPLLRVGGEGDINIGEDTVNYLVKASVVGTLTGQDGRGLNELRGVTVPVRAKGPLTTPSFALDFNALMTDTLNRKVQDTVKSKLEERVLGKAGAEAAKAGTGPSLESVARSKLEERLLGKKPAVDAPKPAAAPAGADKGAVPTPAPAAEAPKSNRDAATDVLKGIFGR
jgi:AsmA protein